MQWLNGQLVCFINEDVWFYFFQHQFRLDSLLHNSNNSKRPNFCRGRYRMEEEKQQQYIQASPHFLWRYATVLQLNRRSLGARLGIDMSSATTGETEMFSGAEIHICARRSGCFYLKSRAEQAVRAELESLHHGSTAVASYTNQNSQRKSTWLELCMTRGLCGI